MNPVKSGLTAAGKARIVVILAVLAVGVAYLVPSLSSGSGTHSATSSQPVASSSIPSGNQTIGLLSLFGHFSQMQVQESKYDKSDGAQIYFDRHTVAYLVLGKASLNSIQYTKVEFSQAEAGTEVIAWFNEQGGVDRVDILGGSNYTGSTASIHAEIYVATFSLITGVSNNATFFSLLSKTSEDTTNIGSTHLDVATYTLAAPVAPYTSVTVRYATIPGTNTRLAVYLDVYTSDLIETTVQVLSITK